MERRGLLLQRGASTDVRKRPAIPTLLVRPLSASGRPDARRASQRTGFESIDEDEIARRFAPCDAWPEAARNRELTACGRLQRIGVVLAEGAGNGEGAAGRVSTAAGDDVAGYGEAGALGLDIQGRLVGVAVQRLRRAARFRIDSASGRAAARRARGKQHAERAPS